jgi:crotonobetainyl-CoA:carnitine CoA-transferase CaiB-like acyl-CoA transferase
MSGAMSLTGFDTPTRAGVAFEDYGTALHTAFGVMVALYHRARTGEGQIVDGSLLSTGVTFMQALLAERSVTGIERERRGNAAFFIAPADAYRTRDGWIVVQVIGPDMFARWAKLVGRQDLIGDARFANDLARADHRDTITAAMNAWLANRTTTAAIAELEAARVPAGPVLELRRCHKISRTFGARMFYTGINASRRTPDAQVRSSCSRSGRAYAAFGRCC